MKRRGALMACSSVLLLAGGCATTKPRPEVVDVDVTGVDSLSKLIAAIRKVGSDWLPEKFMRDEREFYNEIARGFVKNAHTAIDQGFAVPQWLVSMLPARKVVLPALGVLALRLGPVAYRVPMKTVFKAVLGSVFLMKDALVLAIREQNRSV